MSPRDDPPFYFYPHGFDPETLRIGHLVLGHYETPHTSRHYPGPRLSDAEVEAWATSYAISGKYDSSKSTGPHFSLDLAEFFSVYASRSKQYQVVVDAKVGRRVVLKDPDAFFRDQILKDPNAVDQLALWLTVAGSKKLSNFKRKPKVWLLTGLFELGDAQVSTLESRDSDYGAALSSTLVGAVGGPPVGGSAGVQRGRSNSSELHIEKTLIWAAQYHRLGVEYIPPSETQASSDSAKSPHFLLYPDITSKGHYRSGSSQLKTGVRISVEISDDSGGSEELASDEEDREYWSQFKEITANFESLLADGDDDD